MISFQAYFKYTRSSTLKPDFEDTSTSSTDSSLWSDLESFYFNARLKVQFQLLHIYWFGFWFKLVVFESRCVNV